MSKKTKEIYPCKVKTIVEIVPSRKFIKLYCEAEDARCVLLDKISQLSGYAIVWIEVNFQKALEKICDEHREEINEQVKYIDICIKLAWNGLYYEKWKEIYSYMNPAFQIVYNKQKKIVEVQQSGWMDTVVSGFKNALNRLNIKF